MSSPVMIVRPARSNDREAMLRITADVWEGNDYLPYTWDRWLVDPSGYLMVAEVDGSVVGIQHVALQNHGVAWLEAVRVATSARGSGIASRLMEDGLVWARHQGCSVARLSTSTKIIASQRIASRARFQLIATLQILRAEPERTNDALSGVRLGIPAERDAILEFINRALPSPLNRLHAVHWTTYTLSEQRLSLLLAMNSVIVIGDPIEAVVIAVAKSGESVLHVGLAAGDAPSIRDIALWLRNRAAETGMRKVRAFLAPGDATTEFLCAGFESEEGHQMLVYELSLANNRT